MDLEYRNKLWNYNVILWRSPYDVYEKMQDVLKELLTKTWQIKKVLNQESKIRDKYFKESVSDHLDLKTILMKNFWNGRWYDRLRNLFYLTPWNYLDFWTPNEIRYLFKDEFHSRRNKKAKIRKTSYPHGRKKPHWTIIVYGSAEICEKLYLKEY